MTRKTYWRYFFISMLFLSIFFGPFWLSIILAILAMFLFRIFWEGVILFLLSDLLYAAEEARFYNIISISFITSLVTLVLIELLKKKLRFYPKRLN